MYKLKLIFLSVFAFFAITDVRANHFEEDFGGGRRIDLWSVGNMPNSRNMTLKDSVVNHRTWQIGVPRMYVFKRTNLLSPEKAKLCLDYRYL